MFIDRAKKLYTAGEYKKAQYMYRLFSESYPELANIVNVNKIHCAKKFSEQQLYDNTTEDNIKVSVIVPIYNNYQYLNECINSIREQSLHEIEIILIDDGSTDVRVKNLIKKYAEQDERIVAIYKKNTGYGHTMNVGLSCAKSVFGNSFINNETFQQYACHGYLSHGLRHIKASLVIPHKTPPANQPAECSFNYPTLRHWLKACLPWCAFHDFHNKSKIGGLVHQ